MNSVVLLFEGYSKPDPSNIQNLKANCTSSLIRTMSNRNIIVDTRTAWDGRELAAALSSEHGLAPDDINVVICTHGHSDHIGCNYLFQKAEYHFVGRCASRCDTYSDWDGTEPFQLGDGISVHHTPGHTHSCISVVVRHTALGTIGICGDLFERAEDIDDANIWLEAGSEDAALQRKNRHFMAKQCDYIIPGHGPGFVVTQEMRDKLNIVNED